MAFILLSIKTGETRFKTCGKFMAEFSRSRSKKQKKKKERKTKTRYESRNMVLNLELCSRLKTCRNSLG